MAVFTAGTEPWYKYSLKLQLEVWL